MDADDSCGLLSTGDTLKSASQRASESVQLTWSGFEIKCPPMEWLSTKEKPLYLRGVVIDAAYIGQQCFIELTFTKKLTSYGTHF